MGILSFLNNKSLNININLDENTIVTVHNKKEAEFYVAGMLKIANDCANLVNHTKNPDVFFMRYNLLINKLENMSKLEPFKCFSGSLPSQNLENILNKKETTINDFINRFYNDTLFQITKLKTEKTKEKRIENFYNGLSKYNDYMLPKNVEKYILLYEDLLEKIKR